MNNKILNIHLNFENRKHSRRFCHHVVVMQFLSENSSLPFSKQLSFYSCQEFLNNPAKLHGSIFHFETISKLNHDTPETAVLVETKQKSLIISAQKMACSDNTTNCWMRDEPHGKIQRWKRRKVHKIFNNSDIGWVHCKQKDKLHIFCFSTASGSLTFSVESFNETWRSQRPTLCSVSLDSQWNMNSGSLQSLILAQSRAVQAWFLLC